MQGEAKVCWTIFVSEDIDADLRSLLGAEAGSSEELSKYVERAVARAMFLDDLIDIHEENNHLDPDELDREIDAAVREVRREMHQETLMGIPSDRLAWALRAIVDTNLHVSALLKTEAVPAYIFRAWLSHSFSLLTSLRQLEEMRLTFQKPYLKAHIKPHRVGRHINNLLNFAEFVSSSPPVVRSADPEDDYLLAMCAAGRADLLVTGDKNHLLSLKTHGRTQIITAREFAERLR